MSRNHLLPSILKGTTSSGVTIMRHVIVINVEVNCALFYFFNIDQLVELYLEHYLTQLENLPERTAGGNTRIRR